MAKYNNRRVLFRQGGKFAKAPTRRKFSVACYGELNAFQLAVDARSLAMAKLIAREQRRE